MNKNQKTWLWLSTIATFIVGFLLVLNDSGAGWFLIIMAIVYISGTTRTGQAWAESNPRLTWWGLIGVTVLLVLLAVVAGAVLLFQ